MLVKLPLCFQQFFFCPRANGRCFEGRLSIHVQLFLASVCNSFWFGPGAWSKGWQILMFSLFLVRYTLCLIIVDVFFAFPKQVPKVTSFLHMAWWFTVYTVSGLLRFDCRTFRVTAVDDIPGSCREIFDENHLDPFVDVALLWKDLCYAKKRPVARWYFIQPKHKGDVETDYVLQLLFEVVRKQHLQSSRATSKRGTKGQSASPVLQEWSCAELWRMWWLLVQVRAR